MDQNMAYIEGVKFYKEKLYAQAAAQFSSCANSSDLFGRLCRLMLARCYWKNAWVAWDGLRVAKAAENLSSALVLAGNSMEISRYLGRLYGAKARTAPKSAAPKDKSVGAIDMLLDAHEHIRNLPTKTEFEMVRAMSLLRQEKWDLAREHFMAIAKAEPDNPEALRKIGLCFAEEGDFASSAEYLGRAMAFRPGDIALTRELFAAAANGGVRCVRLVGAPENAGKFDADSIAALANVQLEQEDFVNTFLALPATDADQEIFALVGEFMKHALESRGDYADMLLKTSDVMLRLEDTASAIEYARKAVEVNPHYALAHYRLGSMLMDIDARKAASHLARAVQSGGDSVKIRSELGLAVSNMTENYSDAPRDIDSLAQMSD